MYRDRKPIRDDSEIIFAFWCTENQRPNLHWIESVMMASNNAMNRLRVGERWSLDNFLVRQHRSQSKMFFAAKRVLLGMVAAFGLCAGVSATDRSESLDQLVHALSSVEDQPQVCCALMRGMIRGFEGCRNVPAPSGWSSLSERLAANRDDQVRELSSELSQIFGDQKAIENATKIVIDSTADESRRRSALGSLMIQQSDSLPKILASLLSEPSFQLDAIRGYAAIEVDDAPDRLLDLYSTMSAESKRAVIETLATRKPYADALVHAMESGRVNRNEIPVHVARSLVETVGPKFTQLYGNVATMDEDRQRTIAKYKALLTSQAVADADVSRGRGVFQKTCAACHQLYDEGGGVGPDLTGSNRANLDYILLNSVDPSYDVPDAYKLVQILTDDGRVINGVLAEEDGTRVVLKTPEQPRVVVSKDEIESRRISPQSMMPDGQLDQLKTQEVIDLIAYLRTTQQVEIAK
jgi:putative heme-binding domain-containing protein